jgi:glutaredoxin 3
MKHVTIYTKTFCIWCWRAKFLLKARGIPYEEIDASSDATRAMLRERTGRRTVPQIFFGDESIGGFDDLSALDQKGELTARLARA